MQDKHEESEKDSAEFLADLEDGHSPMAVPGRKEQKPDPDRERRKRRNVGM